MGDHVLKRCCVCRWETKKRRIKKCKCGGDLEILLRKPNPKKLARKKMALPKFFKKKTDKKQYPIF